MVASRGPCDWSSTVSLSGQRVAATRARRFSRSASGAWIVNGRIPLAVRSVTAVMARSAFQIRTYGKPQRPGATQEPRTSATGAVNAYRGNSTVLGNLEMTRGSECPPVHGVHAL